MNLLDEICPRPPDFAIDWTAVERVVDRDQLAATPQGPEYHAEGDVWTHTGMVVEALVALPAWRALPAAPRAIVFAGALLHDIGKPACTRTEADGRITSRGHSGRGEQLARQSLWRAGVPFGAREHVCALIRHHQVPFFLVDREAAAARQGLARLSTNTMCRWLALVAEADASGRRCRDPGDRQRILDNTALFTELAAEAGVLDAAWRFPGEHTRFVYLRSDAPERRGPDVVAHDESRCEVLVMSGLPGAGKDAWLARHAGGLPIIALDDIREQLDVEPGAAHGGVVRAARERARELLRRDQPFAWNATNVSRPQRAALIDFLTSYPARVRIVYLEVGAAEQDARNRARERAVPRAAIVRMLQRWAPPAPAEAHRVTYVVDEMGDVTWPPP
jgi:putative nucleotidyltransferase with HDIG domain